MGILRWLKRAFKFRKKYPYRKIVGAMGKWEPCEAMQRMENTSIPGHVTLPREATGWGDEPGRKPIEEALFPYWLRIDPVLVGFLMSRIREGKMYRTHLLKRENKPPRRIDEPVPVLKFFQRRILERILSQVPTHDAAHGFIKGRSIFSNATSHVGQQVVVCMDLRDFFHSITFPRVTGLFISIGLGKAAASKLAALCCFKNRLPQGAPTSPMITNLICRRLDARLQALLNKYGGNYTRYADDLTFSGGEAILSTLPLVRDIISEEGFAQAPEKFRIQRRGGRQKVTGLVVNERVAVPRPVRRLLRAMVHRYVEDQVDDPPMLRFLMGHLNFMRPAHPELSDRLAQQLMEA